MYTKTLTLALVASLASFVAAAPANSTGNAAGGDLGPCDPSMDFQLGRPGRKPDQGTFLPVDPKIKGGQQDALAPGIIMSHICNMLKDNQRGCLASKAGQEKCDKVKADVIALGTKDQTTADAWNQGLKA
ncbi:hypothetical protein HYFRA_00001499 [Hymenoscyphus fraxineus]|uniref:Uncharacterized protein n=1 Tax=Hymenoscyphus fraxineus TaxID=746836 RepID=A0A9N9L8R8_9HELO|nr:hypothetical protein HYFRA_00001499 [Hymenoscyphus fraxineus]